ncbi:hypothetical protein AB0442_39245 [Kitasatospora sp. NPDC085895]|uniref:hypothetical protein n=1 Tax=Kitasatospora sp. NPDC085895 TaxID=3155057 RepID=UPI00344B15F1
MKHGGFSESLLRCAVWGGALLASPLLLVAGGPAHGRFMRHLCRDNGPGLFDKQRGWVHPGYWVVMNPLVLAPAWPTRRGGLLPAKAVTT